MASLIVLKPGVDWTATGGLFDWTLEFLISRLSDRRAASHLQEIIDNNLGSLWIDGLPAATQWEIVSHWRNGLVTAGQRELPETEHKVDVIRHLQELVDATYSAGFPETKDGGLGLYDVVELRGDQPGEQLPAGAVGAVVDIFNGPPAVYEVEFTDTDGRTVALVTLRADQVVQRNGHL